MENKWYAVMMDHDDIDWGWGSTSRDEAENMAVSILDCHPDVYLAVIENDVCVDEIEKKDFNISKRYAVQYGAGQSCDLHDGIFVPVDFMRVKVGEIILYAEMENPTWNDEKECYDDEDATFKDLKHEIEKQAIEKHIPTEWLDFGN